MTIGKSSVRVASESLSRFAGLALTLGISRAYGVENFGIYSVCMVVAMGVVLLSDFGSGLHLTGHLGGEPNQVNRRFHLIAPIRFLVGIVGATFIWLFFYFGHYSPTWLYILGALLIWQTCIGWVEFIGYAFLATGRVWQDASIKFIAKILVSLGVLFLAIKKVDFTTTLFLGSIAAVVGAVIAITLYYKHSPRLPFGGVKEEWKDLWSQCSPLLVGSLATFIWARNDILILQWYGIAVEEIGWYGAVVRLQDMMLLMVIFFMEAFIVKMSAMFSKRDPRLKKYWVLALVGYGGIGLFLLLIVSLAPSQWMGLLFGAGFSEGGWILALWAYRIPLSFLRLTAQYGMLVVHGQKESAQLVVTAMIVGIIANLSAVSFFGTRGAIVSGVAIEFLLAISTIFLLFKKLKCGKRGNA